VESNEQGQSARYACASAGAWSPSVRHWSGQAIGKSTRRFRPKPRGRRPSTAALTISSASANRMRVNVQLIDAETGSHLWGERFDKPIADLWRIG
jgi:hypothetical protein